MTNSKKEIEEIFKRVAYEKGISVEEVKKK